MKEVELKPCPFCDGKAELEYEWVDGYYQRYYSWVHVVCKQCYTTVGRTYDDRDRSKAYAIKVWNTRKPMEQIVERLERQQEEYCELAIEIIKEVGG